MFSKQKGISYAQPCKVIKVMHHRKYRKDLKHIYRCNRVIVGYGKKVYDQIIDIIGT